LQALTFLKLLVLVALVAAPSATPSAADADGDCSDGRLGDRGAGSAGDVRARFEG
jgi:hypothetical protein